MEREMLKKSAIIVTLCFVMVFLINYSAIGLTAKRNGVEQDTYEEDDSFSQANGIVLNDETSQRHNFHDAGDQDWVI